MADKQFARIALSLIRYKPRRDRNGIKLDAPCQSNSGRYDHDFRPWDAHPSYSRCFCGLVRGPRGGLYLVSPIQAIKATPATLWRRSDLPQINHFVAAGRREWKRERAEFEPEEIAANA